jgi:hypothetical protein
LEFNNNDDWQIFMVLGVPAQEIYSYIFEDVDFPDECDDHYLSFLKSILELNDDKILKGLSYLNCFPTISNRLKKITDLYDHNNSFFRRIFGENSDIFLHNDLSIYASVLSKIGFKNELNQATFIECAKKIEELQELDPPSDIRYRGFVMTDYLYKNINTFGMGTLESLMRIKFVPISKKLDKPYSLHYERPVLDCFNNIILFNYKEVAWSQMSLIAEDVIPSKRVLRKFLSLGKPDVPTVIKHLRFLHGIIQNDEWKNNWIDWADTFKHNIYEVYKWFEKKCQSEDLSLSSYIRPREKLFLNFKKNQDPFNNDNWASATDLVLNSGPGEEKYIDPSLAKYSTMLKSAGVKEVKLLNVRINV